MTKVMKECSKHGVVQHWVSKDGYLRCTVCQYGHVKDRRHKLKLRCIDYKGCKCERCGGTFEGYPEVFEFHHLDPSKKDFGFSSGGINKSWEKLEQELDKCIMLCCNCHRMVHVDEGSKDR